MDHAAILRDCKPLPTKSMQTKYLPPKSLLVHMKVIHVNCGLW